jgi:hypothetical protein
MTQPMGLMKAILFLFTIMPFGCGSRFDASSHRESSRRAGPDQPDGESDDDKIPHGMDSPCGPEPVWACQQYCEALCQRAKSCDIQVPSCKARGFEENMCPGESEGHDVEMCEGDLSELENMSCDEMRAYIPLLSGD